MTTKIDSYLESFLLDLMHSGCMHSARENNLLFSFGNEIKCESVLCTLNSVLIQAYKTCQAGHH